MSTQIHFEIGGIGYAVDSEQAVAAMSDFQTYVLLDDGRGARQPRMCVLHFVVGDVMDGCTNPALSCVTQSLDDRLSVAVDPATTLDDKTPVLSNEFLVITYMGTRYWVKRSFFLYEEDIISGLIWLPDRRLMVQAKPTVRQLLLCEDVPATPVSYVGSEACENDTEHHR